jgi:hypothetical protein
MTPDIAPGLGSISASSDVEEWQDWLVAETRATLENRGISPSLAT